MGPIGRTQNSKSETQVTVENASRILGNDGQFPLWVSCVKPLSMSVMWALVSAPKTGVASYWPRTLPTRAG